MVRSIRFVERRDVDSRESFRCFKCSSSTINDRSIVNNPVPLSEQDPEFLWLQIVDTVDDYFRIKTEQRFRKDSEQWLEGRIETYPEIGATALESWRKDALRAFSVGKALCKRFDERLMFE